ncbi:maltose acetyltransferase domain-containing protein [Rufibacter aurantiacus]|uniref:maltose acetyltransferase domain-containing protein n=1 Tax=Rufibacter aurantiacus TaxID=2817374 RepID=UPI001B310512
MPDRELYRAGDQELVYMRKKARQLLVRYNPIMGASLGERNLVLHDLLGRWTLGVQ